MADTQDPPVAAGTGDAADGAPDDVDAGAAAADAEAVSEPADAPDAEPPPEGGTFADAESLVDIGPDDDLDAFEREPLDDLLGRDTGAGSGAASDLAAERDDYRDALLRVKADFENYKKRVAKEHADRVARAAESLVEQLLPVLDAGEAAITQGASDVEPVMKSLFDILTKEGLEVIDDEGMPFDPLRHEAVMHEDGDDDEQVVATTLRTGYSWKGRVIRPAMVKVRG